MMTAKQFADEYQLWTTIAASVNTILDEPLAADLLKQIAMIPVYKSRATRSLGMYISKAGQPVCIRLQFAQEVETLQQTFLHEVAHACDHLTRKHGHHQYRRAHGPGWRNWASMLGVEARSTGRSEAVQALHQQRLKRVAVCQKCGMEFHRVRRLNRNRSYLHKRCGGQLRTF